MPNKHAACGWLCSEVVIMHNTGPLSAHACRNLHSPYASLAHLVMKNTRLSSLSLPVCASDDAFIICVKLLHSSTFSMLHLPSITHHRLTITSPPFPVSPPLLKALHLSTPLRCFSLLHFPSVFPSFPIWEDSRMEGREWTVCLLVILTLGWTDAQTNDTNLR